MFNIKRQYNTRTTKYSYPYNLIENVNISYTPKEELELILENGMSDDQMDGFNFILEKNFDERTLKLIEYRYKDKLTYREIGDKVNLTDSRVREIIVKVLRRFRHPESIRILKYGLKGYEEFLEERARKEEEKLAGSYITEREFGTRIHNALFRAGIKTKDELSELFTTDEGLKRLSRIRNIGSKSVTVILDKLDDQGYLDKKKVLKRLAL